MAERRALGLLAAAVETTPRAYRARQQRDLEADDGEAVDQIVAEAEADQFGGGAVAPPASTLAGSRSHGDRRGAARLERAGSRRRAPAA